MSRAADTSTSLGGLPNLDSTILDHFYCVLILTVTLSLFMPIVCLVEMFYQWSTTTLFFAYGQLCHIYTTKWQRYKLRLGSLSLMSRISKVTITKLNLKMDPAKLNLKMDPVCN